MDFYVPPIRRPVHPSLTTIPTIGIVLCANRNEAVAKYSVLADKKGIFASQYVLCLPTEGGACRKP